MGVIILSGPIEGMKQAQNTDQRLTDLEIKASFTEDLLDQLNEIIVRQQQQIDLLVREIGKLRQSSTEGGMGVARNLRDELPPHF
jgi:SlyX protein